ncbi:hypothetical protein [Acidianus ambivalens]|uniref:Uncharacterized protein n=1 Tax=Acidianus ambivalens TaxID=2283 RepID=A0A650CTC2_ACIAM|nr:hypothetical protein [Acidianus ambivalens]MQL56432.1 hypothetical protein [Acidianus ambivalens]QGR21069.1 hypothetical protein D1866_02810 [Acidianus ambivalens]
MRKSISLLGLGLLVLFLLEIPISTMQVGAYPVIIGGGGGGSESIPVKIIGCDNELANFEGYIVGFNDSGNHGYVNSTIAVIHIPNCLNFWSNCPCKKCPLPYAYAIWIAMSPCPPGPNAGNIFLQAGVGLIVNHTGWYVQMFIVYVQECAHIYYPFYNKTFPYYNFGGTKLCVVMVHDKCDTIYVRLYDTNGYCYKVTLHNVFTSFIPRSAMIIGEIPRAGTLITQCGAHIPVFYYPFPDENFSAFFSVSSGETASAVCMYVDHYVTFKPIYVLMCNKSVTTFEWYASKNSYKLCSAGSSPCSAGIDMCVYLAYLNSKYA